MFSQLSINKETCLFHKYFHYFVHPVYDGGTKLDCVSVDR